MADTTHARDRLTGEDLVTQVAYHLASRDLLLYDHDSLDHVVDYYREKARELLAAPLRESRA